MADVLVVDDQDRYLELCRKTMPEHRYRGPARNYAEAADQLARARGRVDVVLLDVHFDIPEGDLLGWRPGASQAEVQALKRRQGLEILSALRASYPELAIILMTSREEIGLEHSAERDQAEEYTYFLDDDYVDARALRGQIQRIVSSRRGEESDGPVFWGRSLPMRRLRQRLSVLARGRLPVVLLGPTGTGKSLLARHFVHERSGRSGRFVAVDLSTLPQDLMASHLFGSVRGAFTGAVSDRVGAFEAAHQGTLFLDEVGNLSMDAQKMLLSVLQEGTITRLGDLKERAVDVKLVVATNEDLAARVAAGTFRADLYMRLNPATAVSLPPLAERSVDLERLLLFALEQALQRPYLKEMAVEYCQALGLALQRVEVHLGPLPDPEAGVLLLSFPDRSVRLLKAHTWPGNLREFSMVTENAALFALSEMMGVEGSDSSRPDVVQVRPKLIRDLLPLQEHEAETEVDGWRLQVVLRPEDSLNKVSVSCERQYFTQLYLQESGDFARMATVLLGHEAHARKVQLRFNQLGLKVKQLKQRLD